METRLNSSQEEQPLNPEAASAAESAQTIVEPASAPELTATPEPAKEETASAPEATAEEEASAAPEATAEDEATAAPEATADEEATAAPEAVTTAEPVAEEETATAPEAEQKQEPDVQSPTPIQELSKVAVLATAKELLNGDGSQVLRDIVSALRHRFDAIRKQEIEQARTLWAEAGNAPETFVLEDDPQEKEFNDTIVALRAVREKWLAAQEQERTENLTAKNEIIEKIITLAEDTDNVNRTFAEYRELQDQFNAIGKVPDTDETDVWKRFQDARERYSDNLKINKELRDYDFKKNLEAKLGLVDQALALAGEPDIIAAFRSLQSLHEKWREIGPVAKELREELWQKFQDASTVIRKQYQAFFEERKAREAANETAKTALCEEMEAIDFEKADSFNAWEELTAKVLDIQSRWKQLGFAPRKVNNALFAHFRELCDKFFGAKAEYYKKVKEGYAANLAAKTALVEKAEALQDSTDWRTVTEEFLAMQKEWRTIGAVPKKQSDAIWKRFLAACDHFFDAKKKATSGQRKQEQDNLKTKLDIVAAIEALTGDSAETQEQLRALQEQWQQTGHVPFREKDKVNEAYRQAVGTVRRRFSTRDRKAGFERFETNIAAIEGDTQKLLRERDRLLRARETRKNEIRTYENNIGFLNSKSATGRSLVEDFNHKIENLKSDITQIEEKIALINSKLQ